MIFNLIYDFFLLVIALLSLPKLLYQLLVYKKYRSSLMQRFGFGFPTIKKNGHQVIWIHAVSVGEVKAVAPLATMIKEDRPDSIVMISTVTETGHAEAKRSIPSADHHVFLPIDFYWIIAPIVKRVQPDLVILCETDFWYNFLKACRTQGATIALVNGKISERSARRFEKMPWLSKKLFSMIDCFCIQSDHYKVRFESLGIPRTKLKVTGNLKFDGSYPVMNSSEKDVWKEGLGILNGDLVLVAGSTHDPEEKLILDALESVWKKIPNLKLFLVPRHPERFAEVARLLEQKGISYTKFSDVESQDRSAKVVLVDAMGKLRDCYQIADLALVAGSYTPKVGGHNILEPSWYGVPVVFGPYMHSQPELLDIAKQYQCGIQVSEENLSQELASLFENETQRKELGDAGFAMVKDLTGATKRVFKILFER